MEYVYASLLLHAAKQPITEAGVSKVLQASGVKPDEARIKSLVASLEGVNIDEAIKQAAFTAAPAASSAGAEAAKPKEEKKEDEGKKAEEAAAGLSALFG